MKLGIGLPNALAHEIDGRLMLDWARLADDAGFHALSTTDKPNYDSWEPLATLAGVAGVTGRRRSNARSGSATASSSAPPASTR